MEQPFPKIQKSIQDYLEDEDGRIVRSKAVAIGSLLLVMGFLFAPDSVFAGHSNTHTSHSSHSSHYNTQPSHVSAPATQPPRTVPVTTRATTTRITTTTTTVPKLSSVTPPQEPQTLPQVNVTEQINLLVPDIPKDE